VTVRASRFDECIENLGRCSDNWAAPFGWINHQEVTPIDFTHHSARFLTNENSGKVIPHSMIVIIDVAIETATCDERDIEGCCPQCAELPPPMRRWWYSIGSNDRATRSHG
jgi:hypothetical protein